MRPTILLLSALALVSVSSFPAQGARHHRHRASLTTGSEPRLARKIDAILSHNGMDQPHWGISVTTLDGRVLYRKNDNQLFAPASNTKLLTTSTAFALLGPKATVLTQVIANDAPDAQGIVHGDVTLIGAGDPSMSGRAYPYRENGGSPNPPFAALDDMAAQLQKRGVHGIQGNIVGDDTAFPWEPYGSGWAWDDLLWDDGAPASALTINDNVATLIVSPGAHAGDPVQLSWDPPMTASYYTLENTAKTSAAGSQPSLGIDRQLGALQVRVFGTVPAGSKPERLGLAIQNPPKYAAMAFLQTLKAHGITVTGTAIAHRRMPVDTAIYEESVRRPISIPAGMPATPLEITPPARAGEVVLATHTSIPIGEDMTLTLKISQNLHAELFLRMLGRQFGTDGSIEEGSRVVRAFMQRAGMQPQDFFFYDGSGMSDMDRVSPRALTALLRYIAAQPWGMQYRAMLPVGGVDGTLDYRFKRAPLHGHVFAKTGTLNEVNTLSGYVTAKSGRTIVFSILCNGHLPGTHGILKTIDAIVGAIAATN